MSPVTVDATEHEAQGFRRWTLVGMGVAGGLVPSPSALIVLLGAIALGRTAFGVLLVLAYGIGMAATLTTVGYLFARVPRGMGRLTGLANRQAFRRWSALAPVLTAALVLVVGVGLALRSAAPLL
jgi:ABC-type nickel/cobalt efflux system permease component RcnA